MSPAPRAAAPPQPRAAGADVASRLGPAHRPPRTAAPLRLALALVTACALLAPTTAAAMQDDETPTDDATPVYTVTRKDFAPGERFEVATTLSLQLQATVGVGFLAQRVNYDMREEERLDVTVLEPEDGEQGRRRIAYPLRRNTSVAPIVGKKTKERRVHGKSFVLAARDEPVVLDEDGSETREKEAKYVRATWYGLGLRPTAFAFLPEGDTIELREGQELLLDAETAKRLLGLPLDELQVESVSLVVEGEGPGGTVACRAQADLGGDAVIGSTALSLDASLEGPVLLDPATGRVARLEMTGQGSLASQSEDALLTGTGEGTITLRRQTRPLDD